MIKRFQIEDLIVQDSSGVVFRALDSETGKTVAVRRFFPFGAAGGGLHADEQTAYNIAVKRLAGLSHPALRSVVTGGCDPVDGMPFIATEWVEGEPLHSLTAHGPIPAEAAVLLLTQVLEVCELLSQVLAKEAVWVETDLQTIIVSHPESGRGFTFWISPLKWLGGDGKSRGLGSIVTLTEEIMGWTGRIVNDQAGGGLGGWLNWLRETPSTTSLREARESLAASVGADPPAPAATPVALAPRPAMTPPSSKTPLLLSLGLGLVVAIAATWFLFRHFTSPAITAASKPATTQPASNRVVQTRNDGAIPWSAHKLLVEQNSTTVIVEGVVRSIDKKDTGKTIYLLFSAPNDRNAARAGMRVGAGPSKPMIAKFESFIGKKVNVTGSVVVQKISGLNRPDIIFKDISAIQIVE